MLLVYLFILNLQAQFVEKEQVIEAAPPKSFSQKTDAWPNQTVSQEILETQGGSLYDSLQKYPGIQTQGEASSGSPSIRIRGSGSAARSLILFDGTPINTQDGLGANPLLLPTEAIQSIEIIKGPSTLFYGSDAIGGAINLIPKKFERFTTKAGYESGDKSSLMIASPFIKKEKHFLGGSAYFDNSEGNFSYSDPQDGNRNRRFNGKQKQRYFLTGENTFSKTTVSHNFIYAKEHGKTPGPVPLDPTQVADFQRVAFLGGIGVQQKVSAETELKYKINHSRTDSDNIQAGIASTYLSTQTTNSVAIENLSLNNVSLEFSTDFIRNDFKSDFVSDEKLHDQRFEHALVVKSQISDNEYLLTGVRFFPDEDVFSKNILLKQNNTSYLLWASYAEGLRVPSITQKFANFPNFVGNPNLKPEKSDQIEVGAEIPNLSQHLSFKISTFLLEYENFIEFLNVPAPYSYENQNEVSVQGVDAQFNADYKIYHGTLAYSFMKSEIAQTGRPITLAPEHQAYLALGAQLSVAIFELHNTYWSRYRLSQSTESDWWTTDLTVRTSGLSDWEFKAGALNIFESKRVFTDGYPEPGRQYFVFAQKYF